MSKPFWLSKTIWANVLGVAAVLLAGVGIELDPELQAQIVAVVMGVGNIILRFVTKTAVGV
jgi:hypothetical protein